MDTDTPLCLQLRQQTKAEHDKTEALPLMGAVLGEHFSMDAYCSLLKRFFSFYQPLERELQHFLSHQTDAYPYQAKLPLLHRDLQFIARDEMAPHIKEAVIPRIDQHETFLGVLYVLEGSTLGGAMITNQLKKHLDVTQGAQFFYPYQEKTYKQWQHTRAYIDGFAMASAKKDLVVAAAKATFHAIRIALNDESIK